MRAAASSRSVVVADRDATSAERLADLLGGHGVRVLRCSDGGDVLACLDGHPAQAVVSEFQHTDMSGFDLVATIGERWPGLPVILVGAEPQVAAVVAALRAGAYDVLQKPFDEEEVLFVVNKALTSVERRAEQPPPPASSQRLGILGNSPAMLQVYKTLDRAAQGTATVLVRGESGTGKELIARAIHEASPRAAAPFVKIDCASLPEQLLESELFGYEKGAFTGAVARKPGRVELAERGTVFLDEIGELTLTLQAKLLRLLQDREIERLGGTRTIKVDVRVVAATHRDLEGMTEHGQFRLDLFYRLNVVPLWLPPLRARREDIDPLARHFCRTCGIANGKPDLTLEDGAVRVLRGQKWPGNVRQLQNFIERLVVLSTGPVILEQDVRTELSRQVRFVTQPGTSSRGQDAPDAARTVVVAVAAAEGTLAVLPLDVEVRAAEKRALERALLITKQNRSLAARLLGVSRSTLYTKLEEYGLL